MMMVVACCGPLESGDFEYSDKSGERIVAVRHFDHVFAETSLIINRTCAPYEIITSRRLSSGIATALKMADGITHASFDFIISRLHVLSSLLLRQHKLVTNLPVLAHNVLPRQLIRTIEDDLAETIVMLVQHSRERQAVLIAKSAMALNIASHAVHNVDHRLAWACFVSVVVHDRVVVDRAADHHGPDTLVPVDVAREVHVDAVLNKDGLESISEVLLVGGALRAVHGAMTHGDDPGRLLPVNLGEVVLEPLELLVGLVLGVVAFDVAEGTAIGYVGLVLSRHVGLAIGLGDERVFGTVWVVGL